MSGSGERSRDAGAGGRRDAPREAAPDAGGRPPEPRDDLTPSLVVALRDGDASAGALLDRCYRDALRRFCAGYLGDAAAVEDAVQEIYVKVLTARAVPETFRSWLYRVARNHCLNALRSAGRRRDGHALPSGVDLAASLAGPLTRLEHGERRDALAAQLERLDPAERELLRLRYAEDLSRREIAQVLELPESLVKSRLYEAVRKLRDGV